MFLLTLCFSGGVFIAFQQAQLLSVYWCLLLPILLVLLFSHKKFLQWPVAALVGFLYVNLYAHFFSPVSIDEQWIGKDLLLIGSVVDLPERKEKSVRFVVDAQALYFGEQKLSLPGRVRLSWYTQWERPRVGERWQLQVRLKPPHGFANPGGFDFERWLYERGVGATGYVRKSAYNRRLQEAGPGIAPLREYLRERIDAAVPESSMRGFIKALVIGERSDLSTRDWQILNDTGTNHLMAISGLHIGLVAGLVFWFVRRTWCFNARACLLIPAPKVAALAAFVAAVIYAALAGFAIPTQRAMLMLAVLMLTILMGFHWRPVKILMIAYIVVILFDPFAFLSAGMWLSFLAVAAILYALALRRRDRVIWQWGRVQWLITLALVPVLMFYFQRVSLISPLANLFAVPWMSFVVVPLALLGSVVAPWQEAAQLLWQGSAYAMEALWWLLSKFSALPYAAWQGHQPVWWTLPLAIIGLLYVLLPRGTVVRSVGVAWMLPLFFVTPPDLEEGEFELTVLDVGQGQAVVVRTRDHVLLYDTGPRFSDSFNAGQAVVLPYLRNLGVDRIDTLVLSHGDSDHAGGLQAIFDAFAVGQFYNGATDKVQSYPHRACEAGIEWQVNHVRFALVYPVPGLPFKRDNDGSCVLMISTNGHSVLIPGDIEKKAERFLLQFMGLTLRSDVLLVPHHGSKTSSTDGFIDIVDPRIAINSVGFANRYRLPNQQVMERYEERQIGIWDTSQHGAIRLVVSPEGIQGPFGWRQQRQRFWQHR